MLYTVFKFQNYLLLDQRQPHQPKSMRMTILIILLPSQICTSAQCRWTESNFDHCSTDGFPVHFQWCVLHCGHCYCLDCIRVLCEQFSFGGRNRLVKCAVCRDKTYHSDISYVSTTKTDDETEGEMRVQVREIKVQVILI